MRLGVPSPHDASAPVDWNYAGKPDAFFGTAATRQEKALVWLFGLVGTVIIVAAAWSRSVPWTWWQYAIAALVALDVLGGVVANALNSCKRFYHAPLREDETRYVRLVKNPWIFTALHAHSILIGLLYGGLNWTYGLAWYGALLLSAAAVIKMPLYLQRPVALGTIMLAILANYYLLAPVAGFEWLVPALFLKIVYGHLVREEPYR